MVDDLRSFKRHDPDVKNPLKIPLRILLCGPVGAGKSSFISSLNNIFQGRVAHTALVASAVGTSFTKKYRTHYIKNGSDRLPFVFNDVMGLENTGGVHADDIINALKGHIPEDYAFNPVAPLKENDKKFNQEPELKDKAHCLVSVVDGNQINMMPEAIINQMQRIREAASDMQIPQLVVMTKPDEICELVSGDVANIYTSKSIKQAMETCSNRLGVPMICILPVKNYKEGGLNNNMDVLLLEAMTQIVNFANDYIWNLKQK